MSEERFAQKIEGSTERLAGHMLPGTDFGHQLKSEGALEKEDTKNPLAQKVEGSLERLAGHMLPGTDLGHELKAEGALKKGDVAKAMKAGSDLPGGNIVGVESYVEGAAQRTLGHALPGTQTGHYLKAEGAAREGDAAKFEKATAKLVEKEKSSWGGPY
ncbi:hypothetical protein M427DRAFT_32513 [Gonapodya prolifera JEL478]|uniref:Uncharacterized protein n=1 Tax=Gonapodya prolifera (strain JEL478) TaxID=1344416 RepID=A0A139AFV7_GONPJ|nr:hypothetical protein M427DRAFT_32513 [Gonapodya prolifera JEL478]|eukprot:KXS15305.1 hypothetical protein M427DRAFT_32513 [Gonapodya prolifera JEL478]